MLFARELVQKWIYQLEFKFAYFEAEIQVFLIFFIFFLIFFIFVAVAIIIIYSFRVFHVSASWWYSTRVWVRASSLKSLGTLPSILTVLNNVVIWMVSTRPPTSKSSSLFSNPYCSKRTNYNWYYCHPHVPQFFQFPSKVEVLILLFTFFQFYSVVSRDCKVGYFASSLFFFFCWLLLGLVFWPH